MSIMMGETEALTKWTKNYLQNIVPKSNTKAVIGLSGGIDSAVAAAVCVKAVGAKSTIGVILPCESSLEDALDAAEVAKELGVLFVDANLESVFRSWWDSYRFDIAWPAQEQNVFPKMNKMVRANAKARLRMLTLYAIANQVGGLVIGTTNKTEAAIGYATKYGDGGVDIEPLMDFYKTEIWEMAKYLSIPQKIIDRVPSAGLWDGQTDEEELGMTYEEIDRWLKIIESGSTDNSKARTYIEKMITANKHKDLHLPYFKR